MVSQNEEGKFNQGSRGTENSASPEGPEGTYKLRLFVTGQSQRSRNAIKNIEQICEEHLAGQYELEVVDVYRNPDQAREQQILAVPTLLKELPPPLRKVIGDLSRKDQVLAGLDIEPK